MPLGSTNQLTVSVGANVSPLAAGLKQAQVTLGQFTMTAAQRMRRFSATMRNVSLGLGAAAFGIGSILRNTAQGVIDLDRAAQRIGASSEFYQILEASLDSVGGTMQEVQRSSRGLASALVAVRERGDEVRSALFQELSLTEGFFNLDPLNQWLELTDRLRDRFNEIRNLSGLGTAQGFLTRAINLLGVAPLVTRRAVLAESREALLQPGTELAAAGGIVSTIAAADLDRILTRLESIQNVFTATFANRLFENLAEGIFGSLDSQENLENLFSATRDAAEFLADSLRGLIGVLNEFKGTIIAISTLLVGGALLGPLVRIAEVLFRIGKFALNVAIVAGFVKIASAASRLFSRGNVRRARELGLSMASFAATFAAIRATAVGPDGTVRELDPPVYEIDERSLEGRNRFTRAFKSFIRSVAANVAALVLLFRVGLVGGIAISLLALVATSENFWDKFIRLMKSNLAIAGSEFQSFGHAIDVARFRYLQFLHVFDTAPEIPSAAEYQALVEAENEARETYLERRERGVGGHLLSSSRLALESAERRRRDAEALINQPSAHPYYQREREIRDLELRLNQNFKTFQDINEGNRLLQQEIQDDLIGGIRNLFTEIGKIYDDPLKYVEDYGRQLFFGRDPTPEESDRAEFRTGGRMDFRSSLIELEGLQEINVAGLKAAEEERRLNEERRRLVDGFRSTVSEAQAISAAMTPIGEQPDLQTINADVFVETLYDQLNEALRNFERAFELEQTTFHGLAQAFVGVLTYDLTDAIVTWDWSNLGQAFVTTISRVLVQNLLTDLATAGLNFLTNTFGFGGGGGEVGFGRGQTPPELHQGGYVPGPRGMEVPIVALGGELVLTERQQSIVFGDRIGGDRDGVVVNAPIQVIGNLDRAVRDSLLRNRDQFADSIYQRFKDTRRAA